jgi:hypothetical protein
VELVPLVDVLKVGRFCPLLASAVAAPTKISEAHVRTIVARTFLTPSVRDEPRATVPAVAGGTYGTPASAAICSSPASSKAPNSASCSASQVSTSLPRSYDASASATTAENGTPASCATRWAACLTSAGSETVTRSELIPAIMPSYAARATARVDHTLNLNSTTSPSCIT